MSRTSRSISRRSSIDLIPQLTQVDLSGCCVFENPQQWKIIVKKPKPLAKRFIKLTLENTSQQQISSSRCVQSKQTRSRQLSHKSSRQIFEKVKKDFIEQLKLWKEEDMVIEQNPRPNSSRGQSGKSIETNKTYNQLLYLNQTQKLQLYQHPPKRLNAQLCDQRKEIIDSNQRSERRWIMRYLDCIQEVDVNFQTSEGLNTQNSIVFERIRSHTQDIGTL